MKLEPPSAHHDESDRPPFLGTWRKVYAAVLSFLFGLIILFYIFMRVFS